MHASNTDHFSPLSVVASAHRVVALTATAWRIPPTSARAIARRMPSGYVPIRARRRLQRIIAPGAVRSPLAHSW